MNRTFKPAVAALLIAVGFAGSVAAGPFEDGAAAYKKGDYATALRLIRPLPRRETSLRNLISGSCTSSAMVSRRTMGRELVSQGRGAGISRSSIQSRGHERQLRGRPAGLCGRAHVIQLGGGEQKQKRGESSGDHLRSTWRRPRRGNGGSAPLHAKPGIHCTIPIFCIVENRTRTC